MSLLGLFSPQRNGPMIHATHVEQIELLPGGGGSPPQAPDAPAGAIAL
jgi:hypothetical protein